MAAGVIPARSDPRIDAAADIARERVADNQHLLRLYTAERGKHRGEERRRRLFGADDFRNEDPVEQPVQTRTGELFVLRDLRAVRHGALRHPAAEGLHGFERVRAENDGIAETDLIFRIEGRSDGRVNAARGEKLRKTSDKDLRLRILAAFERLPPADIDGGILRNHLVGALAEAKKGKAGFYCRALGREKVQKRSVHVPKDGPDLIHGAPPTAPAATRSPQRTPRRRSAFRE